jgi:hypothetical protein
MEYYNGSMESGEYIRIVKARTSKAGTDTVDIPVVTWIDLPEMQMLSKFLGLAA